MDPFIIFFGLALIFSIIIHEVSHGFAAEMLGDPTARLQGRLTLNPLPHIDLVGTILVPAFMVMVTGLFFGWAKPVPYNPYNLKNQKWGEAIVAGAGPGVNILLACMFGLVVRFGTGHLPENFIVLAGLVVFINTLLAFFNLIPIPPLDGSKLLKSVLPFRAAMALQRFEGMLMSGGILLMVLAFWFLLQFIGPVISIGLSLLFYAFTGAPISMLCESASWLCG